MKKVILILVCIVSFFVNFQNVFAEKIIREYQDEGCSDYYDSCISIDEPFVIQYDTETKKYEFGVAESSMGKQEANLEYNGNKYVLGYYEYLTSPLMSYSYELYLNKVKDDTNVELKPNESLKVYYCRSDEYSAGQVSNGTTYVAIFFDESHYEAYKNETKKPMVSCGFISSNEIKEGKENVIEKETCVIYNEKYKEMESLYKEYSEKKDSIKITKINEETQNLKSICNSIFKYSNYDTPCVSNCLNMEADIDALKKNYGIGSMVDEDCIFSDRLLIWIRNILKWIKYIIPAIVIILGILDFIKAIASSNDDEFKKAQQRFIKRLIAAALLFVIPFIIEFALRIFNLGEANPYCGILD